MPSRITCPVDPLSGTSGMLFGGPRDYSNTAKRISSPSDTRTTTTIRTPIDENTYSIDPEGDTPLEEDSNCKRKSIIYVPRAYNNLCASRS